MCDILYQIFSTFSSSIYLWNRRLIGLDICLGPLVLVPFVFHLFYSLPHTVIELKKNKLRTCFSLLPPTNSRGTDFNVLSCMSWVCSRINIIWQTPPANKPHLCSLMARIFKHRVLENSSRWNKGLTDFDRSHLVLFFFPPCL